MFRSGAILGNLAARTRSFSCALTLIALAAFYGSKASADERAQIAEASKPNFVIILADDLGWGDVSCNNDERSRIQTTRIDQLASQGMRFTDAHSSSGVCSPSRYTLLTGRYHWRSRLQVGIVGYLERPLIDAQRLTIGSLAQRSGYKTACIGKWHLGWNWQIEQSERKWFAPGSGNFPAVTNEHREAWQRRFERPIEGGPITRGFDRYFGTDVPNWPPYCFIDQDRTVGIPSEFLPQELFQNNLASLPGPALADWDLKNILPRSIEQAEIFLQDRAADGSPFLLYLPLTTPHTPLSVNEPFQGASGLNSPVADLILETDAAVGRILDALDRNGQADNTIVVFTSDNGFAPYAGADRLESQGHFPSGPFRGYKGDAWEGGHRVPLLVRWPGRIEAGAVNHSLVHHADLFATVAEVLDVEVPASAGEDSFSWMPLLTGSVDSAREEAVSASSNGLPTLRMGMLKAIFGPGGGGAWSARSAGEPDGLSGQLYDLAIDPGETKNLWEERPEVVAQMLERMEELVASGRSTPGEPQANDVPVRWRKGMESEAGN